MPTDTKKWIYLFVLAFIWGTSYILIKKGLLGFTPLQLGSIRLVIAGAVLIGIGFREIKKIHKEQWLWLSISGFVGSFLPAFLFAMAQTQIDSSIVAILNSLVPLFTILIGLVFFAITFSKNQAIGVGVGLAGALILVWFGASLNPNQNYWYASFILIAIIGYAFNVNIIKNKLHNVSALGIAVGNFIAIYPFALITLYFSDALSVEVVQQESFWPALGYVSLLAIFSTCIAKILFNKLVYISTPVFSVSVTYLIPLVGVFWGLIDGEQFSLLQLASAIFILIGVYLVNKKKR